MPTSTAASDSLSEVRQLVENARALQDSINSFEFLKLKIKPIKSQLQSCNDARNALATELAGVRSNANRLGEKLARSDENAAAYKQQRNRARLEIWCWRMGALVTLYLLTRPN